MKTKYKFTKEEVLLAVSTEPLAHRGWIIDPGTFSCSVCAVGAVIRSKLGDSFANRIHFPAFTKGESTAPGTASKEIKAALKKHNYLGALTLYYERESKVGMDLKAERLDLIQFVMAKFPKSFTVTV